MSESFVLGEAEVKIKLEKISRDMILHALDKIWIAANKIADDARMIVPVDTGRLRDSIIAETPQVKDNQIVCVISANTDYAIYVEMGTYKMAARPYLKPSLFSNKEEFENEMRRLLE